MLVSSYSLRSARPRLTSEPELLRVEVEPREPVVPGYLVHGQTKGVMRAKRIWRVATWKRLSP
jgi:hypothetical protein